MKAALLYEPKTIKVEDVDIPRVEAGEILIKVDTVLTCGTDVKMYQRGHSYAPRLPMIIGHEFAGIIEKVGNGVKDLEKGMKVTAANSAPCNTCNYCLGGRPNLCENIKDNLLGFTVPGAYAEYVKVPSVIVKQNTYQIPDKILFEEAAFLEPLSCAVHGNKLADIKLGNSVAIIGSGPIGLLHLQLAKLRGAGEVVVIDKINRRLEYALSLGADNTIEAGTVDEARRIRELTGGSGVDIVIEAVGLPQTWRTAVEMVGKGGTVILFGGCPAGTEASLPSEKIHYQELTLRGAFHHTPADVEEAFNLISLRRINIKSLITEVMPLDEVGKALEAMADGIGIKKAIHPNR